MRQGNRRATLLSALFLSGFAGAFAGPAAAQTTAAAPDPNLRSVSLVRQDFSDCSNGNVSDSNPTLIGGTAWVVRGSDGKTSVKVGITASPNTTYHFFLKCVRILGDITTQDEGEAVATFEFSTNEAGNVFAFDVYPQGAPAGNKFQSVQVKF